MVIYMLQVNCIIGHPCNFSRRSFVNSRLLHVESLFLFGTCPLIAQPVISHVASDAARGTVRLSYSFTGRDSAAAAARDATRLAQTSWLWSQWSSRPREEKRLRSSSDAAREPPKQARDPTQV